MLRHTTDRLLAALARALLRGFFRRVELDGLDRIPGDRPVLVVANHFNGFVDPVVLTRAFGRVPRFLAKATLWKNVAVRPLLALAGIIPVYRAEDGSTAGNDRTFVACHEALRRHEIVALFPEGTTHDDPYLHELHTGAARIALGARAAGIADVTILPVGLVFSDKLALRARVAIRVGTPIDLDTELDTMLPPGTPADETNRDVVEVLTQRILANLAAVSGDYAGWRQAAWLRRAAEITLRTGVERHRSIVPLVAREEVAQGLADADPADRERVTDLLGRYALDLDQLGLDDDQVVPRLDLRRVAWEMAWSLVALLLLGPFVITGVTVNALPYLAVRVASSSVSAPVTKGTVRFLVGLVSFPLAWALFAWLNAVDRPFVLEVLLAIGSGAATVLLFEQWVKLYRVWRSFTVQRNASRLVTQVMPEREALVDAVYEIVGTTTVASALADATAGIADDVLDRLA